MKDTEENETIRKPRKQVSIRIDIDTLHYFKQIADETGITYQRAMNLYLADCAANSKRMDIVWK